MQIPSIPPFSALGGARPNSGSVASGRATPVAWPQGPRLCCLDSHRAGNDAAAPHW